MCYGSTNGSGRLLATARPARRRARGRLLLRSTGAALEAWQRRHWKLEQRRARLPRPNLQKAAASDPRAPSIGRGGRDGRRCGSAGCDMSHAVHVTSHRVAGPQLLPGPALSTTLSLPPSHSRKRVPLRTSLPRHALSLFSPTKSLLVPFLSPPRDFQHISSHAQKLLSQTVPRSKCGPRYPPSSSYFEHKVKVLQQFARRYFSKERRWCFCTRPRQASRHPREDGEERHAIL